MASFERLPCASRLAERLVRSRMRCRPYCEPTPQTFIRIVVESDPRTASYLAASLRAYLSGFARIRERARFLARKPCGGGRKDAVRVASSPSRGEAFLASLSSTSRERSSSLSTVACSPRNARASSGSAQPSPRSQLDPRLSICSRLATLLPWVVPPNTYQAPGCQEAHVSRAPGLIGSRECSSERPCRLSVP